MKNHLRLGLTGQIATGKSLVLNLFKYHHFYIVDCDILARKIMNENTACQNSVKKAFGNDIVINGQINRKKLGNIVFKNEMELKKLNNIVHPFLFSAVKHIIDTQKRNIIIDAAVLIEAQLHTLVDHVIMVDAFKYIQIQRLQKRNGISAYYAKKIIESQTSKQIMKSYADFIINNNTDKFCVVEQVNTICRTLKQMKKVPKAGIEPARA